MLNWIRLLSRISIRCLKDPGMKVMDCEEDLLIFFFLVMESNGKVMRNEGPMVWGSANFNGLRLMMKSNGNVKRTEIPMVWNFAN